VIRLADVAKAMVEEDGEVTDSLFPCKATFVANPDYEREESSPTELEDSFADV
jgi:hypothetical protein